MTTMTTTTKRTTTTRTTTKTTTRVNGHALHPNQRLSYAAMAICVHLCGRLCVDRGWARPNIVFKYKYARSKTLMFSHGREHTALS